MRYIIGIDLGTTNSCVAYVDTALPKPSIQPFRIPQLTSAGYLDAQATLPSFCYLTAPHEWPPGSIDLPWLNLETAVQGDRVMQDLSPSNAVSRFKSPNFFVGAFAKDQGARVPTQLVRSAKSWLCHSAANRRDKILPFEFANESQRISPVDATACFLTHLKDAWNHVIAKNDPESTFQEQDIVLTVPASFDEVARTLTVEAAKLAGYTHLTLLEEPQAAFYSWISYHESEWDSKLHAGEHILVCDVGGGTTDFSLIEVVDTGGKLTLQRMAVGDHLLLGGDNMDAALAHFLERKLASVELTTTQWLQLCHEARDAKEAILSSSDDSKGVSSYKITLQGTGSGVIRGSLSTEINRKEVEDLLLNGFFAQHSWEDSLQLKKAKGIRTMGLPYEDDPSITKYLAHFLHSNKISETTQKHPDYILFNGGAMKAPQFQEAIIKSLNRWFPEKHIQTLKSANLDLAVSRGAAYYGKVRRGLGVRIGGGTARGYYLAVEIKEASETHKKALTLVPRGCEENYSYDSEKTFLLTPNTPVSFQLYTSHVRLEDHPGDLIAINTNEMQPLPPIHTVLRFGKLQTANMAAEKIPVKLHINLSAIGTLELSLKSQTTQHQWGLEFQLRSTAGQENSIAALETRNADKTLDMILIKQAQQILIDCFTGIAKLSPNQIMENLETLLEAPRLEWSVSTLRKLSDTLIQLISHRKRTLEHESRWWNLIGFCLRPGFGYPLDDFRIKELWKVILADFKNVKSSECQIQSWICYRRISGGLNRGQQAQLASELIPLVIDKKTGKIEIKNKSELYAYSERIRALGSLEFLEIPIKLKLGKALIERLKSLKGSNAEFWAFGRLGSRHMVYGQAANVIPKDVCEEWIQTLLLYEKDNEYVIKAIEQLARKTDFRELNLSSQVIAQILTHFEDQLIYNRIEALLLREATLTKEEQEHILGDQLPAGLMLES